MNTFAHDKRADRMVGDTALILKRFHFLMRECVLAQAGWMPGTIHWETKLLLPEFLWQDALILTELRERVLELRYPERRIEEGPDEEVIHGWRDLLRNAPSSLAFARALSEAIKPYLRDGFNLYLETMDHLDDAPTLRILHRALEDITSQISSLHKAWDDAFAHFGQADLDQARTWASSVKAALASFPSEKLISSKKSDFDPRDWNLPLSRPFAISRKGARDPRFDYAKFPWPDSLVPSRGAGTGFNLQIRQAQAHLNEVWAAEMACAVIFDLGEEGPAEFLKEAARWCFDEIRHCRMGYQRFLHWGFHKGEMPMGSFSYDAGEHLDAITRLGIIFYFETTYINTKSERTKSFSEFGDITSSHDMDFDWADELIHTYYGKKWLKFFLDKANDGRTLNDIKKVAENSVEVMRENATDTDRTRTEELYHRVLRRATELAGRSSAS